MFMSLVCLTGAVNKRCCWLDQTASTFSGKGIGAEWLGWLESKRRLPGIHEHVARSDGVYSDGFLLKMWRCLERWNLISLPFWGKSKDDWMRCSAVLGIWPWVTDCFGCLCIGWPWCCHLGEIKILKMYCCQHWWNPLELACKTYPCRAYLKFRKESSESARLLLATENLCAHNLISE